MKITLKDGSFKEYEGSMSVLDITKDISEGLARVATSARVNGEVVDLRHVVSEDCELEILTFDNEEGKGAQIPAHRRIRRCRSPRCRHARCRDWAGTRDPRVHSRARMHT